MKEDLLHFIWKLKLFSTGKLQSTNGEKVEIISNGNQNFNSGPDFLNAKILIDNQLWAGNVEIHINSSDWYVHHHELDENYDSVILHVVWEHDVAIYRKTKEVITTLELKNFISNDLLKNYKQLFSKNKNWINCESEINTISPFVLFNWFERLYINRIENKSKLIEQILKETNNNWEATFFILLMKNFGLKVNGEAFYTTAKSINFSIVRKVSSNIEQLEALFFGQAGLLLNEVESQYFNSLKAEYDYLTAKFHLQPILKEQVQFFRLRPNNFPTIRLSQIAFLYNTYQSLFSKVIEIETIEDYYKLFNITTSPFWETHFTFEKESKKSVKKLSKSFIDLLLINTIIPIKFWYLKSIGKDDVSSIISIAENIKPESNSIISKFNDLKIRSENAFKTQALLELKNEYCNKQLCLQCAIGKELLKN
ncbi:DUF2851 family protein [Lutibacter sp. B1]|uniref:DUF2851 family protein n=1 Tax=Lutibacter sp. B1 TaxID=2725996 RepID=UPI001457530E|nr:DUF2851 family protein [Lutibacter sp. B1]NLP56715.1 DUF2851 family protein [Lutibacter sp. B1]